MSLAVLHIPFPQLFESERGGRAPATAGLARDSEASKTVRPFARTLTLGTAGIMTKVSGAVNNDTKTSPINKLTRWVEN